MMESRAITERDWAVIKALPTCYQLPVITLYLDWYFDGSGSNDALLKTSDRSLTSDCQRVALVALTGVPIGD